MICYNHKLDHKLGAIVVLQTERDLPATDSLVGRSKIGEGEYQSHVQDTSRENDGHKILCDMSVQLLIHYRLDGTRIGN